MKKYFYFLLLLSFSQSVYSEMTDREYILAKLRVFYIPGPNSTGTPSIYRIQSNKIGRAHV